jgi:hypothetical protein
MADAGREYIVPEGEPGGDGRTLIYHFWMVVVAAALRCWVDREFQWEQPK